jgi:hypothetical protein
MTTVAGTQIDPAVWARDLDAERKRVRAVNAERVRNRGYLVFATDPSKGVDSAEYRHVYATEARTPNQAIAKVRPLAALSSLPNTHTSFPASNVAAGASRTCPGPTHVGAICRSST